MLKRGNKSKAWHGFQNCQMPLPVTCLVLIVLFLMMVFSKHGGRTYTSVSSLLKWNAFGPVEFHPTVEFRNGTEVLWQIPDSPKAVIFLAHGCDGRAINFWDRSTGCQDCIGLPEERLLVLHALAKKFAVLTISSARRCWTFGDELVIVKDIIQWWLRKHELERLSLVALGASSGGYFVSVLAATSLRFSSITIMIAEGKYDQIDIKENYPPTLFVHMPKDLYRQQKISNTIEVLKNKGIDVAEVECIEFPLSPSLLADRIPRLNQTISDKLFQIFRDRGFIDGNGYLKKDGRATPWKEAVHETKDLELDKHLVQHVQEELNLAFAYHEMTSVQSEQIFKWFESHMK